VHKCTQLRQTVQGLFCVLRTPKLYKSYYSYKLVQQLVQHLYKLVQLVRDLYKYKLVQACMYDVRTYVRAYNLVQACTRNTRNTRTRQPCTNCTSLYKFLVQLYCTVVQACTRLALYKLVQGLVQACTKALYNHKQVRRSRRTNVCSKPTYIHVRALYVQVVVV